MTGTVVGVLSGRSPRRPGSARPRCRLPRAVPRPARAAGANTARPDRGSPRGHDRARAPPVRAGRRPDRRRGRGLPHRLASPVSETWIVVAAVGAATVALQVGRARAPRREASCPITITGVVALLAPALLAALVVTQVAGGDEEIVLDARLLGLGAAIGRDPPAACRCWPSWRPPPARRRSSDW